MTTRKSFFHVAPVAMLALSHFAAGQTPGISGTIIDSATLQGVPNAIVSLAQNPAINDMTDAYGNFTLSGVTGTARDQIQPLDGSRISLRNNALSFSALLSNDATSVDAYNAAGVHLYHAQKTMSPGGNLHFDNLWQAPGLYYVKVGSGHDIQTIKCIGANRCNANVGLQNSAGFANVAKKSGAYSLSISKIGYATRQASVANNAAGTDTVRLTPVMPTLPVTPMPIISQNMPIYSSGNWPGAQPQWANDTSQATAWTSTQNQSPAWLAFDLSSKPQSMRHQVLLAWYDPSIGDYLPDCGANPCASLPGMPLSYTIEINFAPGSTAAPVSGWQTVLAVTGNKYNIRQHEFNMKGANWVRINFSASCDTFIYVDVDIYDVSKGVTDLWHYIGDSITYMTMTRNGIYRLQNMVRDSNAAAWPGIVNGAKGGTGIGWALSLIKDVLAHDPSRFIPVAMGTNDHSANGWYFSTFDTVVTQIMAAGRIPVVPILPWPNTSDSIDGLVKRGAILQLYAKYPQIIHGPDFWSFFVHRSDYITPGNIHPNLEGMAEMRKMWVATMAKTYK